MSGATACPSGSPGHDARRLLTRQDVWLYCARCRARSGPAPEAVSNEVAVNKIALLLTAPYIPMIFMGEERGATTPFLFFANFTGDLARAAATDPRGFGIAYTID